MERDLGLVTGLPARRDLRPVTGVPLGKDMGPVELLWDRDGYPPVVPSQKGQGTRGSIKGWRWGTHLWAPLGKDMEAVEVL